RGGIGGEIIAEVVEEIFDYLDAPPRRVAAKNTPVPFAPNLERFVIPQVEDIKAKVKEMVSR
ncbi:alpha-ketoacid dehydrogenase subunit beta, partial [Candidatus Aerophobetes bacterium]|nr:alpha-ketoacid dehydrogenase subunit beta [Candidatus Aerophobetes bacterium]